MFAILSRNAFQKYYLRLEEFTPFSSILIFLGPTILLLKICWGQKILFEQQVQRETDETNTMDEENDHSHSYTKHTKRQKTNKKNDS